MRDVDHADLLVSPGRRVHLRDFDPGLTCDFKTKRDAKTKLRSDIDKLAELQDVFYARGRLALLIIFQGMDAAGKDGAIKHVMSGVNPQGVNVYSFKPPTSEEIVHDYLWRSTKALPERGHIGIFNRSYYEEVGVVRVHEALLRGESLPPTSTESSVWKDRFEDIVAFERHLVRNGTLLLKFFLNISKDEQRKRLLERIDEPEKNWKFSLADTHERDFWDAYQSVYGKMLTHTSTALAPWYVIPADHKWFTRAAVADVIVKRLEALDLTYPKIDEDRRALLQRERRKLDDDGANKCVSAQTTD